MARDAHTEVREYILGMRGETFLGEDFIEYLRQYLERYTRNYGIKVRLNIDNTCTGSISTGMGRQLLRIIQEALANVRKHAGSSSADISLLTEAGRLMLVIEDNGRGFDSDLVRLTKEKSFGLEIMEDRAKEIGGTLSISSVPNGGTKVTVQLQAAQKEGGKQV